VAGKANHRGFGYVRRLPSRRFQASYVGPDLVRHTGLETFAAKLDAEAWLGGEQRRLATETWVAPSLRTAEALVVVVPVTVGEYAASWLARRDLKPRARVHYQSLLDRQILPTFGRKTLAQVTPRQVADWHHTLDESRPTLRAHAYGLLKAMFNSAVAEDECTVNPCRVRGASATKRVAAVRPASLEELGWLVAAMPARYRVMTLLAAWCALRFGELTELRRKDVDLTTGVLRVRRGVARADGVIVVGTPKSDAGKRDVAIPPHIIGLLTDHLDQLQDRGQNALLFPSAGDPTKHLAPATLYRVFYTARVAAGRPDLRWHDLRHTGAVLAAATGATLAELMSRLGHSSPAAAMRYQHAAAGRDHQIAAALSALAAVER
jgi:integrase